jgi:hypothetical protein
VRESLLLDIWRFYLQERNVIVIMPQYLRQSAKFAAGCRNLRHLRQAAAICGRLPQFAAGMRNLPQIASTCRKLLRDK